MADEKTGVLWDAIIIGSGPAGWTAAIYAARATLKTLVFTGLERGGLPGGQLMLTTEVENYPGFRNGIMGPELMEEMREQAVRFGTQLVEDDVASVDFSRRPFTLTAEDGQEYKGRAVIIATGASALWLGLDSEKRLQGRGVSACATCDGFFFKGKDVVVVGGGDTAMEEASFLTNYATRVTVVHRRNELRASKIMQERAFRNSKIEFVWDSAVVDVLGEHGVEGVRLKNLKSGDESELKTDGLFIAIGHKPNTELFAGKLDMDPNGYIIQHDRTETNIPGVFAAGDVSDTRYRQAVTAAGDGCRAALDAEHFLTGEVALDWGHAEAEAAKA
ncbi:MAG: thioredoxin-disulfide reductase [Chloroflexi bacterium]|nr:thioredoxin-disulfide reductase [Chloroflexota bacterium]